MKEIKVENRREGNILSRVFDELNEFCRARSLFILHYCTGCGAIELPPVMTSRFDMERLGAADGYPSPSRYFIDYRLCLY